MAKEKAKLGKCQAPKHTLRFKGNGNNCPIKAVATIIFEGKPINVCKTHTMLKGRK